MSLLILLSPLLTLADSLKSLRDISRDYKVDLFDRLIQPIYNDMVLVQRDYLEILTRAKQMLESAESLNKIIHAFEMDRTKLSATRSSCIELTEELLKDKRLMKYKSFFESINDYFFLYDNPEAKSTISSIILHNLVSVETKLGYEDFLLDDPRYHPEMFDFYQRTLNNLRHDLESQIKSLDEKWSRVGNEYAKLLAKAF